MEGSRSTDLKQEGLSEERADWVQLGAEPFFPLGDGGVQDLTLDVSEPQEKVLLSDPNVIANTPGRTTIVQHYVHQCWRFCTYTAEALLGPLFPKRNCWRPKSLDHLQALSFPYCASRKKRW